MSVDELLMVTWGEDASDARRPSLQTYMSGLRRLLGEDVLPLIEDGRYRIELRPEECDLAEFLAHLRRAKDADRDGHPRDSLVAYDSALRLWPRLARLVLADNSALRANVAYLERERGIADERRAELHVQLGTAIEAIPDLEQLLSEDTGNERAWATLVRAEGQVHGQEAALRAVERARRTLMEEFGLPLPASLAAIQREILRPGEPAEVLPGGDQALATVDRMLVARDGAVPDKDRAPAVSLGNLPVTEGRLFGRAAELELLQDYWNSPDTVVAQIVAWAGVGKSALVRQFIRDLTTQSPDGPTRIYAWSFADQGIMDRPASADLFIDDALRWFGDQSPSLGTPWERGRRLAGLIAAEPTLLVLDGLEVLQHPPGPDEGRSKDQGLTALLRSLAVRNLGLAVLTTRIKVADLSDMREPGFATLNLAHLIPGAGASLLRDLKVRGSERELRQTSVDYNGHALALTLVASWLDDVHDGDIRFRDEIPRLSQDIRRGGHASRVMASYEAWFGEGPEIELLRLVGLLDRAVDTQTLRRLCEPPAITGLNDHLCDISAAEWRQTLAKLRRARLVSVAESFIDVHPLVREHFAASLRARYPEAWRAGNARLYKYFADESAPLPDTLEGMENLFRAIRHGCEAGAEREVFYAVYVTRVMRGDQYFAAADLEALGSLVTAISSFFEGGRWTRPKQGLSDRDRMAVLIEAGVCLSAARGYASADAGYCFRTAATLAERLGDGPKLLEAQLGLVRYHRLRGELRSARRIIGSLRTRLESAGQGPDANAVRRELISTEFYLGEFARVVHEGSEVDANAGEYETRRRMARLVLNDPIISCVGYVGLAKWFLGYPDEGMRMADLAVVQARRLSHRHTLVVALLMKAMVHHFRDEAAAVRLVAGELVTVSAEGGLFQWQIAGEILGSWATAVLSEDDPSLACAVMRDRISAWERTGARLFTPYWFGMLASAAALARLEDVTREALASATERSRVQGETWWDAEISRIRGITRGADGTEDLADALRIADEQGATSLGLRVATDIAIASSRSAPDATSQRLLRARLAAIQGGEGTTDVACARALLSSAQDRGDQPVLLGNSGVARASLAPPG